MEVSLPFLLVLEEVAWESSHHLVGDEVYEGEAVLEVVAVPVGLPLEGEVEEDAEVVLDKDECHEG